MSMATSLPSTRRSSAFSESTRGEIQFEFIDVTPAPIFSGLDRSHDGMGGRMEVFPGVFIFGRIATTDMPAASSTGEGAPTDPPFSDTLHNLGCAV